MLKKLNLWLTTPKGATPVNKTSATDWQKAVQRDNVISITLLLYYYYYYYYYYHHHFNNADIPADETSLRKNFYIKLKSTDISKIKTNTYLDG